MEDPLFLSTLLNAHRCINNGVKQTMPETMADDIIHSYFIRTIMKQTKVFLLILLLSILFACPFTSLWAGYNARPYKITTRESYPASLTSEKVTIAIDPLFNDEMASRYFDKKDIVSRGIMPLAIIIFNDNDFPIEIDGLAIELINEKDHIKTMAPNEVESRLFKKEKSWLPNPIPRTTKSYRNDDALFDFEAKFLMDKIVAPHEKSFGFLYLPIRDAKNLDSYISQSSVYIPNIYRLDNRDRMLFFEILLEAAVKSAPFRN